MKAIVRAKSSSGDYYDVTFDIRDGQISVRCNCKAGTLAQVCKHKTGLLEGNIEMLYSTSELSILDDIRQTEECQQLILVIAAKTLDLAEIEKAKKALSQKEKSIKESIGRVFLHGIP